MHTFLVLLLCFYCVHAAVLSENNEACEPVSPSLTSPKTGQKAWDKCVEYQEKLIYPCEKGVGRGNQCKHNADTLIERYEANPNEFPHMALIGKGEPKISWYCNGVLISDRFILAAGHCDQNRESGVSGGIAALGASRMEDIQESNIYKLSEVVRHPSLKPPSRYNDIALFKTEKPIKLDYSVVPACLYTGDQEDYTKGLYTGWNLGEFYQKNTSVLRTITFDKYTDEECESKYMSNRILNQGINSTTQMCFGDKSSSLNYTCRTDGGGPIQIRSKKIHCMYLIVGVASFGKNCGDAKSPDVYTRVASYVPWIESVVWPATEKITVKKTA